MRIKFCPICWKIMERETDSERMIFRCLRCHHMIHGEPSDSNIFHDSAISSNDKYRNIIRVSKEDRVCQIVKIPDTICENCGKDYFKLIRLGQDEAIHILCKCGNKIKSDSIY